LKSPAGKAAVGSSSARGFSPVRKPASPKSPTDASAAVAAPGAEADAPPALPQEEAVPPPPQGFELVVRMTSGEVLMSMTGADLYLTRADLIGHLLQLAPLPATHIYRLFVGEVVLSGEHALADCGATCETGGTLEIIAVLSENEFLALLLETREQILRQSQSLDGKRSFKEIASFARPPQAVLETLKKLCVLWKVEPASKTAEGYWSSAKQLLGAESGKTFFACVREFDADAEPQRTVAVLEDYCTDPAYEVDNVAHVSMVCQFLAAWIHALHKYSRSIL